MPIHGCARVPASTSVSVGANMCTSPFVSSTFPTVQGEIVVTSASSNSITAIHGVPRMAASGETCRSHGNVRRRNTIMGRRVTYEPRPFVGGNTAWISDASIVKRGPSTRNGYTCTGGNGCCAFWSRRVVVPFAYISCPTRSS